VADQVAHALVSVSATSTFPLVMGIYSAVLGLFIPWGGGKWIIEASEILMTPCCAASSFLAAGPLWVNFCRRA